MQTAPGQWPGAVFMLLALAKVLSLTACGEQPAGANGMIYFGA